MEWEFALLDAIDRLHSEGLDSVLECITNLGNAGFIWIILTVLLLFIPRYRKIGAASAVALILMLFIGNVGLKNLLARLRPFQVREGIALLIAEPHGYSFPSGHTFSSFASATAIARGNRKLGAAALVLAALIAFSRLYFYVHFPTDVLAGTVLGIGCGCLSWKLLDCGERLRKDKGTER